MLREHSRSVEAGLRALDLAILALALPAAWSGYQSFRGVDQPPDHEMLLLLLAGTVLAWNLSAWLFGVYGNHRMNSITAELGRVLRAVAGAAILVAAGDFFLHRFDTPRLLLLVYLGLSLALMTAWRLVVRRIAHLARRSGYNARHFAVVGSGELAEEVLRSVASRPEWGYRFSGLILDDGAEAPARRPTLGRISALGEILESHVLDLVVFALPSGRLQAAEEAARTCQEQGVGVMICLDLLHGGISRMTLTAIDGVPALTCSTVPSDALALAVKRAFDVVVSLLVLLVASPVLVGVAAAIKLDSPGPVFFRQRRVGLYGRHFTFFKFRSMRTDAEAQLEALRVRNEVSGPVFKMANDPRVTRVGHFIRRFSLDEFPQFWNVLRGEMSVVGPRPPLPGEVRHYQRWQRRRLSMKPGITCIWQVSGRSGIDFDRWMQLDLEYIDRWSLWEDLVICLKTVPAVLTARGAH
jgi:exopolysaccharide biosynthesis polyprenyl glycosylphosphotransferase